MNGESRPPSVGSEDSSCTFSEVVEENPDDTEVQSLKVKTRGRSYHVKSHSLSEMVCNYDVLPFTGTSKSQVKKSEIKNTKADPSRTRTIRSMRSKQR